MNLPAPSGPERDIVAAMAGLLRFTLETWPRTLRASTLIVITAIVMALIR